VSLLLLEEETEGKRTYINTGIASSCC